MSYLIDTDWVIDYLKGKEPIVSKLKSLFDEGLNISIISLAELYEGIYASKHPEGYLKMLNRFLAGVVILEITNDICKQFGKLRYDLRDSGELIDNFDLLIASTALHYNLTILTNNKKHFERIKGIKLGCN